MFHMTACPYQTFAHDSMQSLCRQLPTLTDARIHQLPLMNAGPVNKSPLPYPIQFLVKCPEVGAICPITQEPFVLAMPDEALPLDLDHPDRTAIRLACRHDFSAFWLLFNWVHNNHVKCPLCRAGPPDACLDIAKMTPHIRVSLQRHMRKLAAIPTEYDHTNEVSAARQFVETVAGE